jgi:signal transduction histidine kinase
MTNVPETIYTDCKRFKQILFNLLGNAIKFTFIGEIILTLDYKLAESLLITTVKDTGIGISQDNLNKLFHFFGCVVKSKNINQNGMGLGLTISKMIV